MISLFFYFFFLVNEGKDDPNTAISEKSECVLFFFQNFPGDPPSTSVNQHHCRATYVPRMLFSLQKEKPPFCIDFEKKNVLASVGEGGGGGFCTPGPTL